MTDRALLLALGVVVTVNSALVVVLVVDLFLEHCKTRKDQNHDN
jgi:hypothetical protein